MTETEKKLKEQLRNEYKGKARAREVRSIKEQIKEHQEKLKK